MALRASVATKSGLGGALKLARLLAMSERDFETRVREVEANPLFPRLIESGAVKIDPYSARFAARRPEGREMSISGGGVPELLDGRGDLVELIRRVGQERFEEFFLGDARLDDRARARACGISLEDAKRLRTFVDRVYVQAEFEAPSAAPAPPKVFSAVAGIDRVGGKPVIGFFNREIWKGRYRIDAERLARLRGALPSPQAKRLEGLLRQLEFLDRRKSTLYRVLEALLDTQSDYLATGNPSRRRPLTQRTLSDRLDVTPSVLNRLISNKSVRLPWGLEAPLKALIPSAKTLLRERLHDLALSHPGSSDESLRKLMERLHGAHLSRRSIAQYRQDLGLGARGQRE